MEVTEVMVVSSLLVSTDIVAAISIVKYEQQPRLFSIILGEGFVNDVVVIILFQTTFSFHKGTTIFEWSTPFAILGDFLFTALVSVCIGIVFGVLSSLIHKRFRFLTHSAIAETSLIFFYGYLAYGFGELAHVSGIGALVTVGIIMAHYTWYNLSPQGKHVSSVSFQVLGYSLEALVFSYVGLSFFTYKHLAWSW